MTAVKKTNETTNNKIKKKTNKQINVYVPSIAKFKKIMHYFDLANLRKALSLLCQFQGKLGVYGKK